jgi:hypothetical protein
MTDIGDHQGFQSATLLGPMRRVMPLLDGLLPAVLMQADGSNVVDLTRT